MNVPCPILFSSIIPSFHSMLHKFNSSIRVILKNVNVAELFKNFAPFMETEGSLLCSRQPATTPYPQLDQSNPRADTLFL
jgi:hypothetical protein